MTTDWMLQQVGGVELQPGLGGLVVTNWGGLAALPASPCSHSSLSISLTTHYYDQHNTRLAGPASQHQVPCRNHGFYAIIANLHNHRPPPLPPCTKSIGNPYPTQFFFYSIPIKKMCVL